MMTLKKNIRRVIVFDNRRHEKMRALCKTDIFAQGEGLLTESVTRFTLSSAQTSTIDRNLAAATL